MINLKVAGLVLLLISLVVIGSIIAIFVANGYTASPQGISQTGTIRVNADPRDVEVYLDEERVTLREQQITGLEPGEYELRISKEDYSSWQKTVEVQAGLVEDIEAQLFPTNLNLNQFTKTNVDQFVTGPQADYIYYVVTDSEIGNDIGIWRQRISQASPLNVLQGEGTLKLTNLTAEIESALRAGDYQLEISPDNRSMLLRLNPDNLENRRHFILSTSEYNEVDRSVEEIIPFEIDSMDWGDAADELLVRAQNSLIAYDLNENSATLLHNFSSEENFNFAVSNNIVYFYNPHTESIWEYAGNTRELSLANVELPSGIQQVTAASANREALLLSTDSAVYYVNLNNGFLSILSQGIEIVDFNAEGNRVLSRVNEDSKYLIYEIKEQRALNEFEVIQHELEAPERFAIEAIEAVRFSSSGKHLIVTANSGGVYLTDSQGDNWVQMLDGIDAQRINGYLAVSAGSDRFFALLRDSKEQTRQNIYAIDLEL